MKCLMMMKYMMMMKGVMIKRCLMMMKCWMLMKTKCWMLMKTKLSPDYGGGHMDRNQDVPVVLHHLFEPEVRMKRRQGNEKTGE